MTKINVLTKEIYNLISAGEVVERPSSVVKELFENSVDAGANEISVYITRGGLDEIFVQDNGSGIISSELSKAFLPHATSKIESAKDLDRILTLGFRGEALASIAAVSKCRIASKTAEAEIGSQLVCQGGQLGEITESPCLDGTAVTVSELFYNTPARLAFLKQPKSEENEITSTMERLILSNPNVAVKYYANERLVLQSYGDGLEGALFSVYGKAAADNCYEISTEKNGIKVSGFLGSVNFVKSNRSYQTLIVNGRYVTDVTVSSAIQNAYSNYLMKRQYPFYILKLEVPPEVVDVNVHPRKAEVRFSDNRVIYSTVYSIVSKVLDGSEKALEIVRKSPKNSFFSNEDVETVKQQANLSSRKKAEIPPDCVGFVIPPTEKYKIPVVEGPSTGVSDITNKLLKRVTDFTNISEKNVATTPEIDKIFFENKKYIEKLEREKKGVQEKIPQDLPLRYIGQLLSTYLICECGNDMILIDQHAAHERLLYDELYNKVKTKSLDIQSLLIPYTFVVNAREYEMLYDLMLLFREFGIDLEVIGEGSFRVYALPFELIGIDFDRFFGDILTDEKFKEEKIPTIIREKLMQKACKSAIKAGDKLSLSEVDALLGMLKADFGLKCPHGRPVAIKIAKTEIDKWFKRIV